MFYKVFQTFPRILVLLAATVASGSSAIAQSRDVLAVQRAQYDAVARKSVIDIQLFRDLMAAKLPEAGRRAQLISLNPAVNSWFLLTIGTPENPSRETYHLENPHPRDLEIGLIAGSDVWLILTDKQGTEWCSLWTDSANALAEARGSGLPYAPLCDGRLYLRNPASGSRTTLEATAEFLRDYVPGGEAIVTFIKNTFFADSQLETAEDLGSTSEERDAFGPGAAPIKESYDDRPVISSRIGLELAGVDPGRAAAGLWYPVKGLPGVYGSVYQPKLVPQAVLDGPGKANWLDGVESGATTYLAAFDMSRFDIGYAAGSEHPYLNWSSRPPYHIRPSGLPGPDGFSTAAPLERLGIVNPDVYTRAVATFTGGYKRDHGAFRFGDYASIDMGKHYGFIEHGVIWSKLWPDLSTFYVLTDGTIGMKTWEEADNETLLPHIRFARQNGVPLVEMDAETGLNKPGDRVIHWGAGNWSGDANANLRTVRAGACLKMHEGKQFLIYGYFSTATPSAMARVFQAYGCNYAMLLDMNSLEHTYLAVYPRDSGKLEVEHLVPGMRVADKRAGNGDVIPRFLGFADNRDFFYLTLKEEE
jgi:hypothetical protein